MTDLTISIHLPDWMEPFHNRVGETFDTAAARMALAIELAEKNVAARTGGPFGAAVFERDSGRLVAMGVNLVVHQRCSLAHAETVALAAAQQSLHTHTLAPEETGCIYQLATSVAPCAMCLGALPWSGIRSLLCGAGERDAQEIGFDEGDKPPSWLQSLRNRGIEVKTGLLRDRARAVLQAYRTSDGTIY